MGQRRLPSKICATGIDFSMKHIDAHIEKNTLRTMHRCCWWRSGLESERNLGQVNRIKYPYRLPTCGLHGNNLNLSNPVKKAMGEGSLDDCHSAYNLHYGGGF